MNEKLADLEKMKLELSNKVNELKNEKLEVEQDLNSQVMELNFLFQEEI